MKIDSFAAPGFKKLKYTLSCRWTPSLPNNSILFTSPPPLLPNFTKMDSNTTQTPFRLPEGVMCYVEIPAVDVQACKVSSPYPLTSKVNANIPSPQSFYSAVFPTWTFTEPTPSYTDWSFEGPSSKHPLFWEEQARLIQEMDLMGAIVTASPGHQSEIDEMIKLAGEALVATISQCVENIDEVCFPPR
jgi:hypothetical protein